MMTNVMFDKYGFVKRLIGVKMPEPQAEAIAEGIKQHITFDDLATKHDIDLLEKRLESRLLKHINTVQYNCFKMTMAQSAIIIAFLKFFPG